MVRRSTNPYSTAVQMFILLFAMAEALVAGVMDRVRILRNAVFQTYVTLALRPTLADEGLTRRYVVGQVDTIRRLILIFVFAVVGTILGSELISNTDDPTNSSLSQALLDITGGYSTAMGLVELVFIVIILSVVLVIVGRISAG